MEITSSNSLPFDSVSVSPHALLTTKATSAESQFGSSGGIDPTAEGVRFETLLSSPSGVANGSAAFPPAEVNISLTPVSQVGSVQPHAHLSQPVSGGSDELKKAFEDFVGQTFFAEMIKAYRSSQQPSAYFHGGRAEEIFQGQLDQVLAEELSKASASQIADPMFDLFMAKRQT